jgi:uracil phosphoribosyltransferase
VHYSFFTTQTRYETSGREGDEKKIAAHFSPHAAAHLPRSPQAVTTPTNAIYNGHLSILDTNPDGVCAVSIVRAGDSLLECVREIAPSVRVGKMWIQRNESSADKEAVHSCTKLPKGVKYK